MLLKVLILIFFITISIQAKENKVGLYESQNTYIPTNLEFTNEYNQKVNLKEIISNTPTIVSFNYFDCPGLCSPQLFSVASIIDKVQLKPFIDYKIITISIESKDSTSKALEKKQTILKTLSQPFPPQTWSFLTSTNQNNIDSITNSVGFKYEKRVKDGVTDYLHPAMLVVISPKGKIIRYLNGIDYLPFDLKLALLEAQEEKARPTIAKTLLYCFAYDAKSKTYVFQAEKVLGSFIFGIVLFFFLYLIKTGRKKDE